MRRSSDPLSNRGISFDREYRQEVAAAIRTVPNRPDEREREREKYLYKIYNFHAPCIIHPDSISIDKPLGGNIPETDLGGGSLHYSSTVLIVIRKS